MLLNTLLLGGEVYFQVSCVDISQSGINDDDSFEFKRKDSNDVMAFAESNSLGIQRHLLNQNKQNGTILRYPERMVFQFDLQNSAMLIYPTETITYTDIALPTKVEIVEEYSEEFGFSTAIIKDGSFEIHQVYEGFDYSLKCTNNDYNYNYTEMILNFESDATAQLYLIERSSPNSFVFVGDTPYLYMEITGVGRYEVGYMNINYVELYKRQERAFLKLVFKNDTVCDYFIKIIG